jgi:hypothetical protein
VKLLGKLFPGQSVVLWVMNSFPRIPIHFSTPIGGSERIGKVHKLQKGSWEKPHVNVVRERLKGSQSGCPGIGRLRLSWKNNWWLLSQQAINHPSLPVLEKLYNDW